jgi:hypothetical protein
MLNPSSSSVLADSSSVDNKEVLEESNVRRCFTCSVVGDVNCCWLEIVDEEANRLGVNRVRGMEIRPERLAARERVGRNDMMGVHGRQWG